MRQQLLDIGKEAFTTDTFMVHRMLLLLRAMRPTPTSEVAGSLRRRFMVSAMVQEASLSAYVDFLVRMRARIELYDRTNKPTDMEMKEKLEHAISMYAASPANDEYDRRMLMIKSAHSELEAGDLAAGDFDSFSTMSDRISREEQAAAAEGALRDDHHVSYDIDVRRPSCVRTQQSRGQSRRRQAPSYTLTSTCVFNNRAATRGADDIAPKQCGNTWRRACPHAPYS